MFRRVELPRRPAIPLLFHALVALICSQRMVLREGGGIFGGTIAATLLVGALALLCVSLVLKMRLYPSAGICAVLSCSVLLGVSLSSLVLSQQASFVHAVRHTPVSSWTLRIVSDPVPRDDVYRCKATMEKAGCASGSVWLTLPQELPLGSCVQGVGTFTENEEDDWGVSSRMQGVGGSVKLMYVGNVFEQRDVLGLMRKARQDLICALQPQSSAARALLVGCVCGSRAGLATFGLDEAFARCGLAHLIAVSGSHLAVFSALGTTLLKRCHLSRHTRSALLMVGCALFVAFCGAPLSAVRAWIMVCSSLLANLAGRRAHALSSVSLAGIALALCDPYAAGQVGFVLSVAAVSGLCLFSSYAAYAWEVLFGFRVTWLQHLRLPKRITRALNGFGATLKETFCASVVAQVVTMPITWDAFDEVSLVGPIVSVVLSLPFTIFVGVGMLGCACFKVSLIRDVFVGFCDAVANALLGVVDHVAALPYASVSIDSLPAFTPLIAVGFVLALLLFWPRLSKRALALFCGVTVFFIALSITYWRVFVPARVCVLDVGQGDAILVQEGSASLLVDTGPSNAIVNALARNNVVHLDAIVITHLHDDHYLGLFDLLNHVSCERVLFARGVLETMPQELHEACIELTGSPAEELTYGNVLHVAGFDLRMVWPTTSVDGKNNEDSLELLLTYQHGEKSLSALLTGDAECAELAHILAQKDVGNIDFLKVGHHGSEASLTADQARALDPEVAVASAGANNRYGHPTSACKEALEQAGSLFLCTKDTGDVTVYPGRRGPEIKTRGALDVGVLGN